MRVLVAFEEDYRAYREAIATTIKEARPHLEIVVADLGDLPTQMEGLDPGLVIYGAHSAVDIGGGHSKVELALDTEKISRVYVNGQQRELINPSFEELLSIVEEAERGNE